MKKYKGLQSKNRIVVFSHSIVPCADIQSRLMETYPNHEIGVTRWVPEMEDIFYGLFRMQVVGIKGGGFSLSHSRYQRKRRTLPKVVVTNMLLKGYEDEKNPYSKDTMECDDIRIISNIYGVPVVKFEYPSNSLESLSQKALDQIMSDLGHVLEVC